MPRARRPNFSSYAKIKFNGPPSDGKSFRRAANGEKMDRNLTALLHTQTALLFALCATHPNPQERHKAFEFHLQQANQALSEGSEIPALVRAWARTFRLHFAPE